MYQTEYQNTKSQELRKSQTYLDGEKRSNHHERMIRMFNADADADAECRNVISYI